jgi:hypothetical protein
MAARRPEGPFNAVSFHALCKTCQNLCRRIGDNQYRITDSMDFVELESIWYANQERWRGYVADSYVNPTAAYSSLCAEYVQNRSD